MGISRSTPWASGGPPSPQGQGEPPWQEHPARRDNAGGSGLDVFKGSTKTQTKKKKMQIISSALTSP